MLSVKSVWEHILQNKTANKQGGRPRIEKVGNKTKERRWRDPQNNDKSQNVNCTPKMEGKQPRLEQALGEMTPKILIW